MYLIDTDNLELVYFTACPSGQYAILSHTWEDGEELDIRTFRSGLGRDRRGFKKIENCCRQAQKDGYKYAWVDTCCIDKASSAELSEAINSMYAWYNQAAACYAFLADFDTALSDGLERLGECRWFTRGWTSQELVAPSEVRFFNAQWEFIGTRTQLADDMQRITKIDTTILNGHYNVQLCSIAERMSWAAKRTTTRIEDMAYCLLGLFGVSMPLLYGEGQAAFLRLQEEIIRISDDESIFAWTGVDVNGSGLLAQSPANFKYGNIVACMSKRLPYGMTNRGIEIKCELLPVAMNLYVMKLNCLWSFRLGCMPCIYISRAHNDDDQYRRVTHNDKDLFNFEEIWHVESGDIWQGSIEKVIYLNDRRRIPVSPYGLPLEIRGYDDLSKESNDRIKLEDIYFTGPEWVIPLSTTHGMDDPAAGDDCSTMMRIEDMRKGFLFRSLGGPTRFGVRIGFTSEFEPICLFEVSPTLRSLHASKETSLLSIFSMCDLSCGKRLKSLGNRPYHIFKGQSRDKLDLHLLLSKPAFWKKYCYTIVQISFKRRLHDSEAETSVWDLKATSIKCRTMKSLLR